jgi:hypothetical protein
MKQVMHGLDLLIIVSDHRVPGFKHGILQLQISLRKGIGFGEEGLILFFMVSAAANSKKATGNQYS